MLLCTYIKYITHTHIHIYRYEGADAGRRALQGKTIAGAGPLKINASDYMQQYEDANPAIAARARAAEVNKVCMYVCVRVCMFVCVCVFVRV